MSSSRLDAFRVMAAKDPKNPLVRFGLANELVKAGEFDEARLALDAYLASHDDEGAAFRLLARTCEALGLVEEAKVAYRRGIEAATRHGHPSMAAEFEEKLDDLEG